MGLSRFRNYMSVEDDWRQELLRHVKIVPSVYTDKTLKKTRHEFTGVPTVFRRRSSRVPDLKTVFTTVSNPFTPTFRRWNYSNWNPVLIDTSVDKIFCMFLPSGRDRYLQSKTKCGCCKIIKGTHLSFGKKFVLWTFLSCVFRIHMWTTEKYFTWV